MNVIFNKTLSLFPAVNLYTRILFLALLTVILLATRGKNKSNFIKFIARNSKLLAKVKRYFVSFIKISTSKTQFWVVIHCVTTVGKVRLVGSRA